MFVFHFSEVVLSEHVVGRDPDCANRLQVGNRKKCAPKRIVRNVAKYKLHEKWQKLENTGSAISFQAL